jgi:ABC-type transport system involved in cytochrome c biogenesis permease subunit
MLVHFTQAIVRFIFRREDEARRMALAAAAGSPLDVIPWSARWRRKEYFIPALLVLVAAGYVARKAAPVHETPLEMHLYEFGELPIAYGGRTQPMDALARNTLRLISGRATYIDARYEDDRQPAIRWLLDVASRAPEFREHRVFRVEDLDVLQTLGLPQRPGDWRYSIDEIFEKPNELDRQVQLLVGVPKEQLNLMQQNFLELNGNLSRVMMLISVFSQADVQGETADEVRASLQQVVARIDQLKQGAPRPVPPVTPEEPWRTLLDADLQNLIAGMGQKEGVSESPAAKDLLKVLAAYAKNDAAGFNAALADYQTQVEAAAAAERKYIASHDASDLKLAERLALDRINFEAYFNHFDPFMICFAFYIAAFVLAALAWFGWAPMLNRSANWLLWFTLAVHTFGLIGRIYISGRPPVTNLYSSAVFIGWAGALIALVYEAIYKIGIGNLLAAIIGFPTMIIAYQLTFDAVIEGDTFGVMQAVLDTNFWLATHVVCISLGYATTLLAGALGLLQLVMGYIGGTLPADQRRQLSRMTYGTLCFAIFFSFIGTVLGGLWADDSWGRFWGWDPKENGALMIVLWNAIVLHARWGKMVGDRGLASLAVFGNIVVAWSWWGVNQLGVGLHSYGKTSGVTLALAIFDAAMIAVIVAAYAAPLLQRRTPAQAPSTGS